MSARPNIVFILADDMGVWSLGCGGGNDIRTPHLDAMAAAGTHFPEFYCTSPVCSPARATLLTGRIPSQHGVHDWINEPATPVNAVNYLEGQVGLPQILSTAGYRCGVSGKWHLGASETPQMGFDHWYVHQRGAGPYYNAPMVRDGLCVNEPGYVTDRITDDTISFIRRAHRDAAPFLACIHYTAPHSPYIDNHPPEIVATYADCRFASCRQEDPRPWLKPECTYMLRWREHLMGYAASVTAMDAGIGRVVETLDALGIRDDTLVIFLSDNGFNFGHHGIWGKGNATFPLNMYDTSVKVPAIFSHPGRISAGTRNAGLVNGYDLLPTVLDYLGIDPPVDSDGPGRSFRPELEDGRGDGHEHVVAFHEYGHVRMIRTERWKYVHRYPDGPNELYDLSVDPDERENRFGDSDARVVREMRDRLEEWFLRYVCPDRDGTRFQVTGYGQYDRIGNPRRDADPFFRTQPAT